MKNLPIRSATLAVALLLAQQTGASAKALTTAGTGVAIALPLIAGGISVYKDDSTTQSTAGVTLTVDFDSLTGCNHVKIDTSADGTFYSAGSFFDVVITTGTVDSVSAVGTVVGRFTIQLAADVNVAGLTASNLDVAVSTRLASASYTAPDNTSIAAIKTQTDKLTFHGSFVQVDAKEMNDATIYGDGSAVNLWRGTL